MKIKAKTESSSAVDNTLALRNLEKKENSKTLTDELIKSDWGIPRDELTQAEKIAIMSWSESDGTIKDYLFRAGGDYSDERLLSLLYNEKVRKVIANLSRQGFCLGLTLSKAEVEGKLAELVRKGPNAIGMQNYLSSLSEASRVGGFYPDKGNGGVNIQINLVGELGD